MNVCRFADLVVVVKRPTSSSVSILYCFLSVLGQYVLVLALFLEKLLVILLGLVLNTSIAHWSC